MSDEADSVTVRGGDFGRGRVLASITHGQYVTSMNMSFGEAARLRDALAGYLGSAERCSHEECEIDSGGNAVRCADCGQMLGSGDPS